MVAELIKGEASAILGGREGKRPSVLGSVNFEDFNLTITEAAFLG